MHSSKRQHLPHKRGRLGEVSKSVSHNALEDLHLEPQVGGMAVCKLFGSRD